MKLYIICTLCISTICILAEINQKQMADIGKVIKDMIRCDRKYSGKKFLKYLSTYNDYMEDVLKNVDEYVTLGLKQYKVLVKQKGPPFIGSVMNRNRVQAVMNITSDEVAQAELELNRTHKLWEQIQVTHDKRTYEFERTAVLVDEIELIPEEEIGKINFTDLQ